MNFNINNAKVIMLAGTIDFIGIYVLVDNQNHIGVVQSDLFHILENANEIKSKGPRKRFVHVDKSKTISFTKNELKNGLGAGYFKFLYSERYKQNTLKLIDYDTAVKAVEKHYHGPQAGLLLRVLLDNQHHVHAMAKKQATKKFTPSKHKTKDEVIDNLKQSNAKWEKAVNEKAAAYKQLTIENENLHNKLAAAAVENDELKVKNTKLNNQVAELKSTLYDRTVNDTKKSWWQNVKGVFSR